VEELPPMKASTKDRVAYTVTFSRGRAFYLYDPGKPSACGSYRSNRQSDGARCFISTMLDLPGSSPESSTTPARGRKLARMFSGIHAQPRAHHMNPVGWSIAREYGGRLTSPAPARSEGRIVRLFSFLGTAPSPEQLHSADRPAQDQTAGAPRVLLAALYSIATLGASHSEK
jgi:hypothetical protein